MNMAGTKKKKAKAKEAKAVVTLQFTDREMALLDEVRKNLKLRTRQAALRHVIREITSHEKTKKRA
jgi:hypothetical protein